MHFKLLFLFYLLSDLLLLVPQFVDVLVLLQLLLPGTLLQVLGYNICVGHGELLGPLLLLVLLGEEVVDVGHVDGNSWCEVEEKQLGLSCKAILQPPLLSICKTLEYHHFRQLGLENTHTQSLDYYPTRICVFSVLSWLVSCSRNMRLIAAVGAPQSTLSTLPRPSHVRG